MANKFLEAMKSESIERFVKGGKGSGFFGHKGRDAENLRGGSMARGDTSEAVRDDDIGNEKLREVVKRARHAIAIGDASSFAVYKQVASSSYHYIDYNTWTISSMKDKPEEFEFMAKVFGKTGLEWGRKGKRNY